MKMIIDGRECELNEETPFILLIPIVLMILCLRVLLTIFDIYDSCLPRWPVFRDFSSFKHHLNTSIFELKRHLYKVKEKK